MIRFRNKKKQRERKKGISSSHLELSDPVYPAVTRRRLESDMQGKHMEVSGYNWKIRASFSCWFQNWEPRSLACHWLMEEFSFLRWHSQCASPRTRGNLTGRWISRSLLGMPWTRPPEKNNPDIVHHCKEVSTQRYIFIDKGWMWNCTALPRSGIQFLIDLKSTMDQNWCFSQMLW